MTIISTWKPVSRNVASITLSNPGIVTTTVDHDYDTGLIVRLFNCGFPNEDLINNVYRITVLSSTSFSLNTNTTNFPPFQGSQTATITNITNANPMVVTVGAHSFTKGIQVHIQGVVGMTFTQNGFTSTVNGLILTIIATTPTTISFNLATTGYTAYVSGGTVSTISVPQVIPVGEVAEILTMAEQNIT